MKTLTKQTRYIMLGIAIVVIAGATVFITHRSGSGDTSPASNTTASGTALSSTGENSSAEHTSSSPSVPIIPGPTITIHLLTPISNNVWKIGQQNPIAWDNAANITGEIDLVDAKTKAFIGVILSNTGANQTSYIWDARSIYRARYSADKKDVVPGIYSIRIHFDGNNLGSLVSGPIMITN